jgi:hypothetical protein
MGKSSTKHQPRSTFLRSSVSRKAPSKGQQAISKRLRKVVTTSLRDWEDGSLEKLGWKIFRGRWSVNDAIAAQRMMLKKGDNLRHSEDLCLRGDCNRIQLNESHLTGGVVARAKNVTDLLKLKSDKGRLLKCRQTQLIGIASYPGALRQDRHVDTNVANGYTVLHALSTRLFHVDCGFTELVLVELHAGDVIVLKNGVCHAGAANEKKTAACAIHVPLGWKDIHTHPCTRK